MILHSPASLPHNDTSKSRMSNFFSHPLRSPVIIKPLYIEHANKLAAKYLIKSPFSCVVVKVDEQKTQCAVKLTYGTFTM